MKKIYCVIGGSMRDTCSLGAVETFYPESWPYKIQQECVDSIDGVREFVEKTGAKFINFSIRANGIPNRAVSVSDTEKLNKVFRKFEMLMK